MPTQGKAARRNIRTSEAPRRPSRHSKQESQHDSPLMEARKMQVRENRTFSGHKKAEQNNSGNRSLSHQPKAAPSFAITPYTRLSRMLSEKFILTSTSPTQKIVHVSKFLCSTTESKNTTLRFLNPANNLIASI